MAANFQFLPTPLPDLFFIKPRVYQDARGFFLESYQRESFLQAGITDVFVQDNHSKSQKGVLRGLHFQKSPKAQAKLVRVISGAIFDAAVDIRKNSPTFGKWFAAELSGENKKMLFIPTGFAHGFYVLKDNTEVLYKTSENYAPELEAGIIYNDPDIGIVWPLEGEPILSEKDRGYGRLRETELVYE